MKRILFLILVFTVSCKVTTEENLYDKDHPLYPALQQAATQECLAKNKVFENLKTSDFTDYNNSMVAGKIIQIKDGSDASYFIKIVSVTSTRVEFDFYGKSTGAPYLLHRNYAIDISENNNLVDMIATGVCSKKFGGNPEASESQLQFSADRFQITDSTDVNSTTTPGTYNRRQDSFTVDSSLPAFLFLWNGRITRTSKATADGSVTTDDDLTTNLSLTVLSTPGCPSGSVTCTDPTTSVPDLTPNMNEFDILRTTGDDAVTRYYFDQISL